MTAGQAEVLRVIYRSYYPVLIAEYPRYDVYIVGWENFLTRAEFRLWSDIRCVGLPLLPKFPVDQDFVDFADPVKRLGVSLIGDQGQGRPLRKHFEQLGWTMYEVLLWQTRLDVARFFDADDSRDGSFWDTAEGILETIRLKHYVEQR